MALNARWRSGVKSALLATGHYRRSLARARFPGIAVLCYHGVRPDDWPDGMMTFEPLHVRASELDAHCRLLAETCHPITLEQWRASLHGGPPLPARPVLVTFDDGYRTVATVATPILERHGIPAVLFVCATPIQSRSLPADDPHALLTVEELQALARRGFEIGSHSATHITLSQAPREGQWNEIAGNEAALRAWIGTQSSAFAYPFGQPTDYSPETQAILREHGYEFAFTTTAGFAVGHPGLECPRFVMLASVTAAELAHRLAYSWRKDAALRPVPVQAGTFAEDLRTALE